MFPAQFDYRRADSVGEAVDLLATDGDRDVQPLAGGHGLVPDVKAGEASPDVLVDVSGIDGLAGIEAADGSVVVGALTTHADLAASDLLRERAPVLAAAAAEVADVQIRNRGTIGGNLAEADPAADLPAAVLAADATVRVRGPDGERAVPADEFFRGAGETALARDELMTAVEVPPHPAGTYVKKTHPATGYAMVGVAAVAAVESGTVSDLRVAANGVMDRAVRLRDVERAATGTVVDPGGGSGPETDREADRDPEQGSGGNLDSASDTATRVTDAATRAAESLDPDRRMGDVHASAEFRAGVLETYVERALAAAVDAAAEGGAPA